jgi:hypothetical protein
MAENNEDTLTRVVLTAVEAIKADSYFSPPSKPPIPVVSDVQQDIFQAIKMAETRGMLIAVGLDTISFPQTGGCLAAQGNLIVRVQEIIGQNRSASGVIDNGLRVAQKVGLLLSGKPACLREDGTKMTGGSLKLENIEPQAAIGADGQPLPQGRAYHVNLSFNNCSLVDFTRRTSVPQNGAP